ncbi:hypothetical protein V6G44_003474 [Burkholderia multivorans]|nr:hypothetical protein C6P76_13100 [Burkholderia multivorans]PRG84592.1 hypothetical protein C6T66_19355 [Burkholderia multivorans]HDW8033018.1 hypothetical protein [Burkholderia multivorans]HDY4418425.1 hypothetical protein [Burkholderia multivorans]HEA3869521.1 hypothetical protein [Burkholderia multivorans]
MERIGTPGPRLFLNPLGCTGINVEAILTRRFSFCVTMSAFVRHYSPTENMRDRTRERFHQMLDATTSVYDSIGRCLAKPEWTPIQGALMLSGIWPSSHWIESDSVDRQPTTAPISHRETFEKLLSELRRPENGLDKEPVPSNSSRFRNARGILAFWDHCCEHQSQYFHDVNSKEFTEFLAKEHRKGNFFIPEPNWLELFAEKCGVNSRTTIVPSVVHELFSSNSQSNENLIPKHRLRDVILKAWISAKADGCASNNTDQVLIRIKRIIEAGEAKGLKLIRYDKKIGIEYQETDSGKVYTLLRDSLARQLRRMIARQPTAESIRDPRLSLTATIDGFPYIRRTIVDSDLIGELSPNTKLIQLACDFTIESSRYIQLSSNLQVSKDDHIMKHAIIIGNLTKLWKLLVATDILAAHKTTEALATLMPPIFETIVDIKYLATHATPELVSSYIERNPADKLNNKESWNSLSLEFKARSVDFGDLYDQAFGDSDDLALNPWEHLTRYHLALDGDAYRAKLSWAELDPSPLLTLNKYSLNATMTFVNTFSNVPFIEELRRRISDLHSRILAAQEIFEQYMYTRWPEAT